MRRVLLTVLVCWFAAGALSGQTVEVSLSSVSPEQRDFESGDAFKTPLGAFRFEATGGPVQLDGFILTVSGSGDFKNDLKPNGLRLWLDDGDGAFDPALDTKLAAVAGAEPAVSIAFEAPVIVQPAAPADIWIEAYFLRDKGGFFGRSFVVEIAMAIDVDAPGASVALASPAPVSEPVTLFVPASEFENVPPHSPAPCSVVPIQDRVPACAVLALLCGLVVLRRRRYLNMPSR